jgi:hypothetical protein
MPKGASGFGPQASGFGINGLSSENGIPEALPYPLMPDLRRYSM